MPPFPAFLVLVQGFGKSVNVSKAQRPARIASVAKGILLRGQRKLCSDGASHAQGNDCGFSEAFQAFLSP